jgi:hypothetical protein
MTVRLIVWRGVASIRDPHHGQTFEKAQGIVADAAFPGVVDILELSLKVAEGILSLSSFWQTETGISNSECIA